LRIIFNFKTYFAVLDQGAGAIRCLIVRSKIVGIVVVTHYQTLGLYFRKSLVW